MSWSMCLSYHLRVLGRLADVVDEVAVTKCVNTTIMTLLYIVLIHNTPCSYTHCINKDNWLALSKSCTVHKNF